MSAAAAAPEPLSVQISTVLYKLPIRLMDRLIGSVANAVAVSKSSGRISHAVLEIGDCSPMPTLTETDIEHYRELAIRTGLDGLKYRFFNANLGSAAGHNALLADLQADLLWIINPDTAASPYVLNEMLVRLGGSAYGQGDIGMVEARQIPIEHPKLYDLETGETSWATTACALFPRSVIEEVGPFDADTFFLYCDDVDYSWRIRLTGRKVVYAPSARIFHDKRTTSTGVYKASAAEQYYSAEAALLMAYKYSREDLVSSYMSDLRTGPDECRKAVAEFESRRRTGRLPRQLDPDRRVSEFPAPGLYAEHRK